jgi:hypothetical protein
MWITVATMQFEGAAARWLQSIQPKLHNTSWTEFCSWLVTRFGRSQHQALLRQLYHIQQQTSVTDYVERFAELIDQLAAYEQNMNSLHYVTRFQDGLWPNIRAAVAIQCPVELDTAYSLALLQEEMSEQPVHGHGRELSLPGPTPILALPAPPRRPLPLPVPPPTINRTQVHLEKQPVAESSSNFCDSGRQVDCSAQLSSRARSMLYLRRTLFQGTLV